MRAAQPEHLQEFAERVRKLVAPFGSIARAARGLGIPENTLRRACAGANEPQAPLLIALSTKLNVSMSYLLGLSDDPAVVTSHGTAAEAQSRMRRIPRLGADRNTQDDSLVFPQWMLAKLAPADAALAFIRATDDSMRPLFGDGALLLVDETDTRLSATAAQKEGAEPAIFAYEQAGGLRIRGLRKRKNGEIIVLSPNPAYDPEIFAVGEAKRIKLLGRVVWWDDRL